MKLFSLMLLAISLTQVACSQNLSSAQGSVPVFNNEEDIPSPQEVEQARQQIEEEFPNRHAFELLQDKSYALRMRAYSHIDPQHRIPQDLLAEALAFFDQNKSGFRNQDYITIIDFGRASNETRFFIVDMQSGGVASVRVAHGAGSDPNNDGMLDRFSNSNGSHQTSEGFYKVAEIYKGKYGRSIRMDGLSSTNSNVRARAIVIHGSDYVVEENRYQGMSWGCFALAWSVKDDIVDILAGGSLLYASR